jgi:prevent-host-death family protein
MKSIAAGEFKHACLNTIDEVVKTKTPVVITKRGQPLPTLMPYGRTEAAPTLAGSILKEIGDPYGTSESWAGPPRPMTAFRVD